MSYRFLVGFVIALHLVSTPAQAMRRFLKPLAESTTSLFSRNLPSFNSESKTPLQPTTVRKFSFKDSPLNPSSIAWHIYGPGSHRDNDNNGGGGDNNDWKKGLAVATLITSGFILANSDIKLETVAAELRIKFYASLIQHHKLPDHEYILQDITTLIASNKEYAAFITGAAAHALENQNEKDPSINSQLLATLLMADSKHVLSSAITKNDKNIDFDHLFKTLKLCEERAFQAEKEVRIRNLSTVGNCYLILYNHFKAIKTDPAQKIAAYAKQRIDWLSSKEVLEKLKA